MLTCTYRKFNLFDWWFLLALACLICCYIFELISYDSKELTSLIVIISFKYICCGFSLAMLTLLYLEKSKYLGIKNIWYRFYENCFLIEDSWTLLQYIQCADIKKVLLQRNIVQRLFRLGNITIQYQEDIGNTTSPKEITLFNVHQAEELYLNIKIKATLLAPEDNVLLQKHFSHILAEFLEK